MTQPEEPGFTDMLRDIPRLERQLDIIVGPFMKKHQLRPDQIQILYTADGASVQVKLP